MKSLVEYLKLKLKFILNLKLKLKLKFILLSVASVLFLSTGCSKAARPNEFTITADRAEIITVDNIKYKKSPVVLFMPYSSSFNVSLQVPGFYTGKITLLRKRNSWWWHDKQLSNTVAIAVSLKDGNIYLLSPSQGMSLLDDQNADQSLSVKWKPDYLYIFRVDKVSPNWTPMAHLLSRYGF